MCTSTVLQLSPDYPVLVRSHCHLCFYEEHVFEDAVI